MPTTKALQVAATKAVLQIAVPLADLLLEAGMSADDLLTGLRFAFVEAAVERARVLKRKPQVPRIARKAGVPPEDVTRWMRRSVRPERPSRGVRSHADHVLWRWWTHEAYRDRLNRHPAVLPMAGGTRSFETLVRDCTGSSRAVGAVLDELLAVNAVRRLKGHRLRVVRQSTMSHSDAESFRVLGRQGRRHLEGLLDEMRSRGRMSPFFVRGLESGPLDPAYLPILRRDLRSQAAFFIASARDTLSASRYQGRGKRGSRRIALALHIVDEPSS